MNTRTGRFRDVPNPPLALSALAAAGAVLAFVLLLPVGAARPLDAVIEGAFLVLAVAIAVPVRRFGSGLLDVGWQVFVLGRLIDFLDELFVEPEPIVEPYLSGLLMVVSLSIVVLGAYAVLEERRRRIEDLAARDRELSLKNDVFDEAPVGVTVADVTEPGEPLVYVNDAFTRMTGYEREEAVGDNCRFLQGRDTDPETVAEMRAAIDDDDPVQVTLRNYRKDGECFWNEITLAPIPGPDGAVSHYAGFQQDVTVRQEYERRLRRQRDDLRVLNRMFQHDIRNTVQAIRSNATLLGEHVAAEGAARLDRIEEATRDAMALADTADDLSRTMLETDPDRQRKSLRASVEREVDDLRAAFEDVTVDVEGAALEVTVTADDMLDSVFRNALRNAVQHNDKERPAVTVSASRTGEAVVVRIADNGPGIPDDRKAELFDRGTKGAQSRGTGIGTYLIDTLVARYGGDVWVEDNQPEGAVFAVKLPVADG